MSWFGGKKKEKKREYSGFPGDCSDEQLQALQKFQKHVHENTKLPTQRFDEIYLLRFLRARKFDLPKTSKMWDDYINWRVKNNIDNCLKFQFPELLELRKMYPHGYHKVDKHFRPIYIERAGFIDVDKIFKVMKTQDMLNYYSLLYETLLTTIFDSCTKTKIEATKEEGKVCQTITILDLKHVKLGSVSKAYDFLKPVTAMAQDNYPQILGNMFIINAPMLFTGIWAIVKMWIDDKTKQKIKIFGSSYKKELLEYIDAQNLPAFIDGGKCTCDGKECRLQANVGPWNPEGKEMFASNIHPQQIKQVKPEQIKVQKQVHIQQSRHQEVSDQTQTQEIEPKIEEPISEGTQTEEKQTLQANNEEPVQKVEEGTETQTAQINENAQQQKGQTQKQEKQEKTSQSDPLPITKGEIDVPNQSSSQQANPST